MSIEEKAEEYRSDTFRTPFRNDIEMAFIEGAQWMLEKSSEWIKNEMPMPYLEWVTFIEEIVKQFREAMDE